MPAAAAGDALMAAGVARAAAAFAAAVEDGTLDLPLPGSGRTWERWWALSRLATTDPVLARLGEGHADAVAILAELGGPAVRSGQRWGVWAAVPASLVLREGRLYGDRPWCSGAGSCTHALVTAGDGLYAVSVADARPLDGTWPAVGMAASDSRTVRFDGVPAVPVGAAGEYVNRPGFAHGGMGVAACWYGGAVGVARALLAAAAGGAAGPHALAHLGAVDAALAAARALLESAAAAVDADPKADARLLAARVRAAVEAAATQVLDRTGRALGAGPLCRDAAHAHRVADLTVYLRQSHAEADLAALADMLPPGDPGW